MLTHLHITSKLSNKYFNTFFHSLHKIKIQLSRFQEKVIFKYKLLDIIDLLYVFKHLHICQVFIFTTAYLFLK